MTTPPPEPDFDAAPQGEMVRLTARDGHVLDANLASPGQPVRGGLVIAQEMYGLTRYLTGVCDFYAAQGYLTIAPALYDRRRRGLVLDYTPAERDRAHDLFTTWNWELALLDLDAARARVAQAGKVGILGFCWGGSLAWLAACRGDYACAISYYGSHIPDYADEIARCPVLAHCGDADTSMPIEGIRAFEARRPEVTMHVFAGAQHAFDNPLRGGGRFHADASQRARAASLAFLQRHLS